MILIIHYSHYYTKGVQLRYRVNGLGARLRFRVHTYPPRLRFRVGRFAFIELRFGAKGLGRFGAQFSTLSHFLEGRGSGSIRRMIVLVTPENLQLKVATSDW